MLYWSDSRFLMFLKMNYQYYFFFVIPPTSGGIEQSRDKRTCNKAPYFSRIEGEIKSFPQSTLRRRAAKSHSKSSSVE